MNVLHVTPSFYPATYWGGPIHSTHGLCNSLANVPGLQLRVITTDTAGPEIDQSLSVSRVPVRYGAGYDVYFFRRRWGASGSPEMLAKLWSMIRWADLVHLTAVYSPPTIPTLLTCRLLRRPVVWSPRGGLQRWERATAVHSKAVWDWVCRRCIREGTCALHVTSPEEARDAKERIPNADIAMIPNGVDVPDSLPARQWLPNGRLRLIFVGRLHPIKGIENLLQALHLAADSTISLKIFGTGEDRYVESLRQLIVTLGLEQQATLEGQANDEQKRLAFLVSDVCVVPSFSENFGMVVAEALAHGVPVIASKGTPWSGLETHACGLWVENSADVMARVIQSVRSLPLAELGLRGRTWMKRSFSWTVIAQEMAQVYSRLASASAQIHA